MPRRLLLLQSFALALVLTWPAPARFGSELLGTPKGDAAKHAWNLWWTRAEVGGGASGLLTQLVNWPAGMRLYPIEPLDGLVALLIPLEPVALANLLAVVHVALLGACAGWLGWLVTGSERGALTTAALAQGASFVAFTLHVGVGELRQVWWIPLGLACLVKAQETRAPRWFAALGGCLAVATLACFYHGFFLATAVSLHALASLRRDRALLLGYLGAAVLAVAVVVPVVRTFAVSYGAADASAGVSFLAWMTAGFAPETFPGAALDLPDIVRSRAADRGADALVYAYTGGRYVGVVALILAALGVAAAPRRAAAWAVVAVGAVVLAMGTVVWWGGEVLALPIALPMTWINRALAWVAEPLNFPVRFVSVTMVATAVLGGLAVTRWRWLALLVPVALVDIAANDLVPWPRDTTVLPVEADVVAPAGAVADLTVITRGLGRSPDYASREGALLPSWLDGELRTRAIGAQMALDRPFQTVPIERQEMWALDGLLWTAVLPLSVRAVVADTPVEDPRESIWLLRERGFGSIVLTHACGGAPDAAAAQTFDELVGPRRVGRCFALWALPEVEATEAEAERWARVQAERVRRLPTPRLQAATMPTR
ncbi:MAG: hypothetical protein Q8P41_19080 [Pseudomonadota bacterium]|nr:hypothetical protein [Pseudomonadota bacterium]